MDEKNIPLKHGSLILLDTVFLGAEKKLPHYFIVLNKNPAIDNEIVLVHFTTSKATKKSKFSHIMRVHKSRHPALTEEYSYIDCSAVRKMSNESLFLKIRKIFPAIGSDLLEEIKSKIESCCVLSRNQIDGFTKYF